MSRPEIDRTGFNYENMPMQYTEIFAEEKKMKIPLDLFVRSNMVGTHKNATPSTHNVCFGSKIRKSG